MESTTGRRGAWLVAVLALVAIAASHADEGAQQAFGQRLLAEYSLPATTVARYAGFKPNAPMRGESKVANALLADTVEWLGPETVVGPGHNPYRLVLRVRGQAIADGDVASLWRAGWRWPTADFGTQDRVDPVTGVTRERVRAGDALVFVAPSSGSTFKEEREVRPFVGLVNVRNLRIDEVTVEVWQGVPPANWQETLLSLPALGIGVVMLLLLWWWRR
jgi:hypothetical protein